jgi:hypothetical protein
MKVVCLQCGHEFELTGVSNDELGWHTVCPKCDGSFDAETNETTLILIIEDAKRYCKGELELDLNDDVWIAWDYREDLEGAFPIDVKGFNDKIITVSEAENSGVDVRKCCDICGVAYVG